MNFTKRTRKYAKKNIENENSYSNEIYKRNVCKENWRKITKIDAKNAFNDFPNMQRFNTYHPNQNRSLYNFDSNKNDAPLEPVITPKPASTELVSEIVKKLLSKMNKENEKKNVTNLHKSQKGQSAAIDMHCNNNNLMKPIHNFSLGAADNTKNSSKTITPNTINSFTFGRPNGMAKKFRHDELEAFNPIRRPRAVIKTAVNSNTVAANGGIEHENIETLPPTTPRFNPLNEALKVGYDYMVTTQTRLQQLKKSEPISEKPVQYEDDLGRNDEPEILQERLDQFQVLYGELAKFAIRR